MKKKDKRIHKNYFLKDMRFLQRMMLVYIIGGIIPLILVSILMNVQTRNMMIHITEGTQKEENVVLASSIRESMTVLDNVAHLLCINDQIRRLATKAYKNRTKFYMDYNDMTTISDYMNFYQQDISYINIYLNNVTIRENDLERMKYLSPLTEDIKKSEWYRQTVGLRDEGYWYFAPMPKAYDRTIQVSRALRNDRGEVLGIVTVLMQYHKIRDAIANRRTKTVLFYNDYSPVYSNFNTSNYSFLSEDIKDIEKDSVSKRVMHGVREYLLSYQKIHLGDEQGQYSLVCVEYYPDILESVNRISLRTFLPELLGIVISLIMIFAFSTSFGNRLGSLRVQMHHVAQGEYESVEPIEGNDEIGQLYRELESMMKDIQQLTAHVVDEQVQKEKLHTRQKEVEFKMLASQINPHFLYNTLETIRMKAVVNHQPEIVELVKMLAKTMRYSIQASDQMVTLKEELQMAEYYLKIQNYRFGDRITSETEVADNVDLQSKILPLTIQPFVENAFVHGLESKEKDGLLQIRVYMEGEKICVQVRDNGMGMDYYSLGELRRALKDNSLDPSHIGIKNVNQRIKLLFGRNYGVEIDSKLRQGTVVTIRFPYWLEDEFNP